MAEVDEQPKGWQSKEDWVASGKPEEEWVSKEVWDARGELLSEIRERDKKLSDLQSKVDNFGKLMVEEKKRSKEAGIREAEDRHAKAVAEGDLEGAQEALHDVRELSRQAEPVSTDPVKDFFDRNPEFLENPDLFAEFDRFDRMLGMKKGGITEENMTAHLNEVANMVRERHQPQTSATEAPSGRTVGRKKSKPTRSDLPEHLQATHDAFTRDGTMSSEEYIQGLIEVGEFEWP